jgi:hypothetical protein
MIDPVVFNSLRRLRAGVYAGAGEWAAPGAGVTGGDGGHDQ